MNDGVARLSAFLVPVAALCVTITIRHKCDLPCAAQPSRPPRLPHRQARHRRHYRSPNCQHNQHRVTRYGAVSGTSDAPRGVPQALDSLGSETQGESRCWGGCEALPANHRNLTLFWFRLSHIQAWPSRAPNRIRILLNTLRLAPPNRRFPPSLSDGRRARTLRTTKKTLAHGARPIPHVLRARPTSARVTCGRRVKGARCVIHAAN
jgi:hypothetical protein